MLRFITYFYSSFSHSPALCLKARSRGTTWIAQNSGVLGRTWFKHNLRGYDLLFCCFFYMGDLQSRVFYVVLLFESYFYGFKLYHIYVRKYILSMLCTWQRAIALWYVMFLAIDHSYRLLSGNLEFCGGNDHLLPVLSEHSYHYTNIKLPLFHPSFKTFQNRINVLKKCRTIIQ